VAGQRLGGTLEIHSAAGLTSNECYINQESCVKNDIFLEKLQFLVQFFFIWYATGIKA